MSDSRSETNSVSPEWLEELTSREAIRKRPAMFVGDTGLRGLHNIVDDILTHSLLGRDSHSIVILLKKDGSLRITDDGSEFSIPLHVFLTTLPAPGGPEFAFAVANALCEQFAIEAVVKGKAFSQEYRAGIPLGPGRELEGYPRPGLKVTLKPDPEIFSEAQLSSNGLRNRLEELAFLHSGVSISFEDEVAGVSDHFKCDDGIRAFVEKLNQGRTPLHSVVVIRGNESGVHFEVGLQFCRECAEIIRAYVNETPNPDWGTHVDGVRIGLARSIESAAPFGPSANNQLKWQMKDYALTAVVSVRMESPQFMGSTKSKLGSPEAQSVVASHVGRQMTAFLLADPDAAAAIIQGGNPDARN